MQDLETYVCGEVSLGNTCAMHSTGFHGLQHMKAWLLERVLTFMRERSLQDAEQTVRQLQKEKDGVVEQWYEKFQDALTTSEQDVVASNIINDDDVIHF